VSAKTGDGLDEAMKTLIEGIVDPETTIDTPPMQIALSVTEQRSYHSCC
jgi:hypothetical protein